MRVVVLHEEPGADPAARSFREAAESFNRGLDIRLRFLDVGFELRDVPVAADATAAAERLAATIRSFRPGRVLVLGSGPALLECAALAAKEQVPIAFLADGTEDRSAGAIARFADLLVVPEGAMPPAVRPETRVVRLSATAEDAAPSLVDLLLRNARHGRT